MYGGTSTDQCYQHCDHSCRYAERPDLYQASDHQFASVPFLLSELPRKGAQQGYWTGNQFREFLKVATRGYNRFGSFELAVSAPSAGQS
jgi:hypothetical protein